MGRFYLSPICQVADLIRKPALPLPFAAQTEKVKRLSEQFERAGRLFDGGATMRHRIAREQLKLIKQVQAYFDRQRQFPWNYAMEVPNVDGLVPFDQDGCLPPAVYHVDWQTVVERYGYTPRRRRQLNGLLAALHLVRRAGGKRVQVGGSFVTAKPDPGDIDCEWISDGLDTDSLEPMLRESVKSGFNSDLAFWISLRREYFGLDLSFSRDSFLRRGFFECTLNLPDELRGFPLERAVGMLSLDLRDELPSSYLDCEKFFPFSMWAKPSGLALERERFKQLRERLPEHWENVSSAELSAMGIKIMPPAFI